MLQGVVRTEEANLTVTKRPALIEIGGDPAAVQFDRLVAGSCRKSFDAPVVSAAAMIYAGYLATGNVAEGEENHWMDQAIKAAFRIATVVDASIVADKEMG